MKYRADIDGLRALAVLPVVLYHADISFVPGGFVGVDVFFVISGFLIASLLMADAAGGAFSVAGFYKRRILRIFPALFAMMAGVAGLAYTRMFPADFEAFGDSLAAASLFSSNLYFWLSSGYFDTASAQKPLLHTWSLAIEEQFYIVFPLLVYAIHRWAGRRFAPWFAGIVLASFGLSIAMLQAGPAGAFYLLPARAWELGLGALVAAGGVPRVAGAGPRNLLAAAGLAMLAYGVFFLSRASAFPGWNALFPCVGAALVIAYGEHTLVGRLLRLRLLVFVGLISYSLYLWHWPIFALYKIPVLQSPDKATTILLLLAAFAAAAASYYLVERPFRTQALRQAPSRRVVGWGAGALAIFVAAGLVIARFGGSWIPYPPQVVDDVRRLSTFSTYRGGAVFNRQYRAGECFILDGRLSNFDDDTCLKREAGRPNVLVLGDSHAAHLWQGLAEAYPEINFIQATAASCRPLPVSANPDCTAFIERIVAGLDSQPPLDGVILSARWRESDPDQIPQMVRRLKAHAARVVILGPTAEYHGRLPILLAQAVVTGDAGLPHRQLDLSRAALDPRLARAAAPLDAAYVSLQEIVCPGGSCIERAPDGAPMQFDNTHFTASGARLVARRIRAAHPGLLG